ncbi:MAG: guanylate kinase [Verrucomicrobiota bacterium]|nr:guanylate kinase [Verrucomicrobiota bacterium]
MKSQPNRKPLLIVICGPSGVGKSTLCDRLREEHADIVYSISCTTRPPRGAERDGREYHFLTGREFDRRASRGLFLEHALVHGRRYGTLKENVYAALNSGRSVLMDIDVQGARQIRRAVAGLPPGDVMKEGFVDILVRPPCLETLRRRLETRAEDKPETVETRLRNAVEELAATKEFRHTLVNDRLKTAFAELTGLLNRERRTPPGPAGRRRPKHASKRNEP